MTLDPGSPDAAAARGREEGALSNQLIRLNDEVAGLRDLSDRMSAHGIAHEGEEVTLLSDLVGVLVAIWTQCGINVLEKDPDAPTPVIEIMRTFRVDAEIYALTSTVPDGVREKIRKSIRREVAQASEKLEAAIRSTFAEASEYAAVDEGGRPIDYADQSRVWWRTCRHLGQYARELDRMEAAAEKAALFAGKTDEAAQVLAETTAKVDEQVQRAKAAANTEANGNLASHFKELADKELGAAFRYRAFAVTLVALAVGISFVIHSSSKGSQWSELPSYLPGLALTLTGVYLARLAGPHFHLGKWAAAVEVQLKSFEGFTGVVEDGGIRERMREEFGRRVLGPPPLFDASAEPTPGLTTTDVLQILAAVRRQDSK
ncbi:hypothetical protein H1W00_08980 [Aeromicrobium sp. Marseille-Q0843]|uniref:Uncharacterized protein n=1 Tax=Aeromicrobium phoceense TaxID=2754045 RepID=A0A838XJ16_9ACTN|nr:hypothetical protein [Aeromicrobium phoceense]MBA4608606.1 hypothetical protein [Aeromicrobium phoceense]